MIKTGKDRCYALHYLIMITELVCRILHRQVLRVPPADGLLIVQNTGDVGARARGYLLTSPKATSLAGECSNVWLELLSGNDTDPTSLTVRCTGLNEGKSTLLVSASYAF